jgi:hypothetical protein
MFFSTLELPLFFFFFFTAVFETPLGLDGSLVLRKDRREKMKDMVELEGVEMRCEIE